MILFLLETHQFEIWLCGYNKNFQTKYWNQFKESNWDKYHLVPTTPGYDSILEHILIAEPDFRDLNAMTEQIEQGTLEFFHEVEGFLSTHQN